MPLKKDIIYPIFLECCTYSNNVFWENIFEYLAYGVCPYGTYISKDFICCGYKKKEFSYKIDSSKSAETIYNELYDLFSNKLGLISPEEKLKKKIDYVQIDKTQKENWNDIRKKNIKEILLEIYVIKMKNQFKLNLKQTQYLFSMILIGIMLKIISSKDIILKNGNIQKINGINFEIGKIIFEKDFYNIDSESNTELLFCKKSMIDTWESYIKKILKINE
jgi:hypothetical protein